MLPVKEILGEETVFVERETAIISLKCEHLCVCVQTL